MDLFTIDIDWAQVTYNLTRLAFAYILALPIAWNREHEVRSAGLRTFPLVAVASCGFMLQGMSVLETTDAEARVMYGIVTGIGFIGGGAIIKDSGNVTGTATAASIWTTGAIGTAVAWQRYEIAILLSLLNFLTLSLGSAVKKSFVRQEKFPDSD
jgi:putative Mg2+ transporter-C (MgtC) family protein